MRTQEQHFDTVAADYDDTIPSHVMAHLTRRRVELATLLLPAGGRVLDVGCGTGTFLKSLPQRYERVGVDASAAMLSSAASMGIEAHHATADHLPFEDASFELVATFAVLHHLIDPAVVRGALQEMCRVVRPGGAVIVWDHNPLNPYWPLLMRRLPQDQGDEKLVPARTVLAVLGEAGMREITLRRLTFTPDFTPPAALGAVTRVERVLERIPGVRTFAAHNVVTARR
jgi:ubiquinone/menaquinone biosynthesis C-methylase UbiE